MNLSVQLMIADIQKLTGFEYFHLSPCGGCGCPMWQQPCAICDHYPMGAYRREVPLTTKEQWCSAVKKHGNVYVWREHNNYRYAIEEYRFTAQHLWEQSKAFNGSQDWPSPEEIWDAIK